MALSDVPVLRMTNVEKTFGTKKVIDVKACEFGEGIHWIKGENGAGKSTLFRILAGMLPFNGDIVLDGAFDIRRHPVAYRFRVSFGEAEPQFPSFLTPDDLIRFVAKTRKSPSGQTEQLKEHLGVQQYSHQPIGTCSSGMVKKVSLVLAFLGEPRLIILDEPLITIDQEAQLVLFDLIKEYRQKSVSFLISSHQLFDGTRIGETTIFRLDNGRLIPISQR